MVEKVLTQRITRTIEVVLEREFIVLFESGEPTPEEYQEALELANECGRDFEELANECIETQAETLWEELDGWHDPDIEVAKAEEREKRLREAAQ